VDTVAIPGHDESIPDWEIWSERKTAIVIPEVTVEATATAVAAIMASRTNLS
jgi:hypothetical protein